MCHHEVSGADLKCTAAYSRSRSRVPINLPTTALGNQERQRRWAAVGFHYKLGILASVACSAFMLTAGSIDRKCRAAESRSCSSELISPPADVLDHQERQRRWAAVDFQHRSRYVDIR